MTLESRYVCGSGNGGRRRCAGALGAVCGAAMPDAAPPAAGRAAAPDPTGLTASVRRLTVQGMIGVPLGPITALQTTPRAGSPRAAALNVK